MRTPRETFPVQMILMKMDGNEMGKYDVHDGDDDKGDNDETMLMMMMI